MCVACFLLRLFSCKNAVSFKMPLVAAQLFRPRYGKQQTNFFVSTRREEANLKRSFAAKKVP